MSSKQIAALSFIARNPGVTAADVTRYEWSGRGHAASYERVTRLWRRGMVTRISGPTRGGAAPLAITERGLAQIGGGL